MANLPTNSKFRFVQGKAPKFEGQYGDVRLASTMWDSSNFIAANSTHFAVPWLGGGGKLVVHPLNTPGKIPSDAPALIGHTAPILDWAFHPFAENLLATCSEDTTVRIWSIPSEGLKDNVSDAQITLSGHGKKVGLCLFHHVANHVLFTASMDHQIKVWDIEQGEKLNLGMHKEQIYSMALNLEGSQMATTGRDKKLRIVDVRSNEVASETDAHTSNKMQKVVWAKQRNQLVTVGFSKMQERQCALWDPRELTKPIHQFPVEGGTGSLMMFYDEDTTMLYLAGKGESSIKYFQLWDLQPPVVELSAYMGTNPQKGLCMLPKLTCDTTVPEVARFLRLEKDKVIPVNFHVPRKTAAHEFQSDIYPDTFDSNPTMSAAEYFSGESKAPNKVAMTHGAGGVAPVQNNSFTAASAAPPVKVDTEALKEAQKAKVEKLRKELAEEEAKLAQMEAEFAAEQS